jgi:hypothetical protein
LTNETFGAIIKVQKRDMKEVKIMKKINITKTYEELIAILRSLSDETIARIEDAVFAYEVEGASKAKAVALLKKVGLTYDEWDYLGY